MSAQKKLYQGDKNNSKANKHPRRYNINLRYLFRHVIPRHQLTLPTLPQSRSHRKEFYPLYMAYGKNRYRNQCASLIHNKIGENFRALRIRDGLTVQDFSAATSISQYKLRKLEEGSLRLSATLLVVISDFFHVSIESIVFQNLSDSE